MAYNSCTSHEERQISPGVAKQKKKISEFSPQKVRFGSSKSHRNMRPVREMATLTFAGHHFHRKIIALGDLCKILDPKDLQNRVHQVVCARKFSKKV